MLIRVKGPGIVHGGVNRDGKWIHIYGVPLKEVSPGVWQAYVLDPEVNEFTFIWYDPKGTGNVHWEGKNYLLQRLPAWGKDHERPRKESVRDSHDDAKEM